MELKQENGALVLFSGGQDSTVCVAWALHRFSRVETVGFNYGQRHGVELECRLRVLEAIRSQFPEWDSRLGQDHVIDMPGLGQISETALTRPAEIVMTDAGLPSTFVPGRNLLFFTYAAAVGYRRGIRALVGGMCETDYSGYPDCRATTLSALEEAISLGTDTRFSLQMPLMHIDKAGTWALADDLGGARLVELIVEETHSCYLGERRERHPWGYGCGRCPACELRAKGWDGWQADRKAI